jgi:hypothetical protein
VLNVWNRGGLRLRDAFVSVIVPVFVSVVPIAPKVVVGGVPVVFVTFIVAVHPVIVTGRIAILPSPPLIVSVVVVDTDLGNIIPRLAFERSNLLSSSMSFW